MTSDPRPHRRRSIRLPDYDYTQPGAYFVTICAHNRECLFGDVVDGHIQLNDIGRMLWTEWHALPARFPGVRLDAFVVMPNHVHGILWLVGAPLVGAPGRAPTRGVPTGPDPRADAEDSSPAGSAPTEPDCQADAENESPVGTAPTKPDPRAAAKNRAPARGAPTEPDSQADALGNLVGAFKSITANRYLTGVQQSGWMVLPVRLWQRNYHEHIIRNEDDLRRIRAYIRTNPARWTDDPENPERPVSPHPRLP